jgi:hypothetical protein
MKKYCLEHHKTRELIDSLTDDQLIDLYFTPDECAHEKEGCEGRCPEIGKRCRDLANFIIEVLPDRGERLVAIRRLQEVMFWATAGLRRIHAVNNRLQFKQTQRDLYDIGCNYPECREKEGE